MVYIHLKKPQIIDNDTTEGKELTNGHQGFVNRTIHKMSYIINRLYLDVPKISYEGGVTPLGRYK